MLRKLLFVISALIFLCSQKIYGQDGVQATVNIRAEVIQTIELITVKGMTIRQTRSEQQIIFINPINSGDAGHMIAVGNPEADIRINFIKDRELTRTDGVGLLKFNYQVTGNTDDNQLTSELLGDENRALRFNEEGQFYIWVGGTVDLQQATPGNYEGEFTLEIEYI
jgi:hypothetical protein